MTKAAEQNGSENKSSNGSQGRTLRCRTVVAGKTLPVTHIRSVPITSLEEVLGLASSETRATHSELLLAILGSCLAERIHANASIGNIAVANLVLEMEADLAASPIWGGPGPEPGAVGFETIRVKVHVDTAAEAEALHALIAHAVLWSPIANTLHSPIHLDVALATAAPP